MTLHLLAVVALTLVFVGAAGACPPNARETRLVAEVEASIEELAGVATILRDQGSIQHAAVLDERAEGLRSVVAEYFARHLRERAYCACLATRKPAHKAACAATRSRETS